MTNQDVQRLEGDAQSQIILPRVLENLTKHDKDLLIKRANLLNSGKYKGNTKELGAYKQELPSLTKEQIEFGVGLLLGDTTLQSNLNGESFRLKTQQKTANIELLQAKEAVYLPWVLGGISPVSERDMLGLQTITHPAFKPLVDIMHDSNKPLTKAACMQKKMPANIGDYLTPIAIGIWFSGDGSRRDHGKNQGKAIQFHSQGFTPEDNKRLANALAEVYGWKTQAKLDYINPKGVEMYLVQVEASSFDSFYETVEPYILPNFKKRLPLPRSNNSRFRSKD